MEGSKNQQLITEDQLKSWTQFEQQSRLLEFLRNNGIAYFRGKGGTVLTTLKALNDSLITGHESPDNFDW